MGPGPLDYVERARELTERLASREVAPGDVAAALDAARRAGPLDVDVPTTSARPEGRALKSAVKRLVAWYMSYLAEQVNDLGFALLRLGEALAVRAERSDSALRELEARLGELERRLRQLESNGGTSTGHQA